MAQEPYTEGSCNVQPTFFDASQALSQSASGTQNVVPRPAEWLRRQLAALKTSDEARAVAEGPARQVLRALGAGYFKELAAMVDPAKGVCLRASFSRGCRWMSAAALRDCATNRAATSWNIDTGSDDPKDSTFTCRDALQKIFYSPDFSKHARVAYNCFPENASRSNCGGGYVDPEVDGDVYVEFHVPDLKYPDGLGWKSLWLTFQTTPRGVVLRGMMSEYWGI